ncbi:MAG: CDP-alcohol phosphatidyltransferase family protein [Ruminococcaceae bacterium]|nr:CDP-alcohol phosphatidyltransferase family protein [Oscillospiraceae bacterium]
MESKFSDSFRDDGKIKVFTIPNILSMFRICLIPLFIWLYVNKNDREAFFILILSGMTDVVDGFIARRFGMISAVGKALDPISDKLTQVAVLYCLLNRFEAMWIPFVLMIFKEVFSAFAAFLAIKKTGEVHGADWHGKLTTISLYGMMGLHIVWQNIPPVLSNVLVGICVVFMLISLVMYSIRNFSMAKNAKVIEKEKEIA